MSDYEDHLFSYVPAERFDTFSFGHVIPSENLTARALTKGIHGTDFNFTFEHRNSDTMVSFPASGDEQNALATASLTLATDK
jgi:chromosome transmission fidelity protein 1